MVQHEFVERITRLEENNRHREEQLDEVLKELKELKREWQKAKGAWWMFVFLGGGIATIVNIFAKFWKS